MHQRNSSTPSASAASVSREEQCARYLADDLYAPLPSVGLVVRPVPHVFGEQQQPELATKTLALSRSVRLGHGSYNTVWSAELAGKPVVLRIAAQAALSHKEVAEAGVIAPVIDSFEPVAAQGWTVRPAQFHGVAEVPAVFGDRVKNGEWSNAQTMTPEHHMEGAQFGVVQGLVMDRAPGVTLKQHLKMMSSGDRVPLEKVRDLVVGMSHWIDAAMKHDLVHSDLKSANLMASPHEITLIDHTPMTVSELKRLAEPDGFVFVKGTQNYTDIYGMNKAADALAAGHIDEDQFRRALVASQMRAVAIIALECLNGGKHPVSDHPERARRGQMGMVESETYEHALQQISSRYKASPTAEVNGMINLLRSYIKGSQRNQGPMFMKELP